MVVMLSNLKETLSWNVSAPKDILEEWQCPDPLAKVIFKIEEAES